MQNWYNSINRYQKVFLFGVSVFLIVLWGIGLIALAILVYLDLGAEKPVLILKTAKKHPKQADEDYLEWANRTGRWAEKEAEDPTNKRRSY